MRSAATFVQLFTFLNPMSYSLAKLTNIEGLLHGLVLGRYAPTTTGWNGLTFPNMCLDRPFCIFIVCLNVVVAGVFQHPRDVWPIEMTLQFTIAAKFDKCQLSVRVNPCGLHAPLGHFKMDD